MNNADTQYLALCNKILTEGKRKKNRTGVDTLGLFGAQMRFDLSDGFPLLTTKKMNFSAIVHELLWFISGNTNIKYLVDNGVNIWNQDALRYHNKLAIDAEGCAPASMEQFLAMVKEGQTGDLGYGTYGSMWRQYPSVFETSDIDQLVKLIHTLKTNPDDRRMIVTAWHPGLVDEVALPPCHIMFQFHTEIIPDTDKRRLNLQMYQRSCDMFLGVPFNIASYALLLKLVANCVEMVPGEFVHTLGDYHIYENHVEQMKVQINREADAYTLPSVWIDDNERTNDLFQIRFEDIKLSYYDHHPLLKGQLA